MREVHGIPDARRYKSSLNDTQSVRVIDGDGSVILVLASNAYDAEMTPEQARFIGLKLQEAADRVTNYDPNSWEAIARRNKKQEQAT